MRKTILKTLLATSLLGLVAVPAQSADGIYMLSGGVVTLGAPTDVTPPTVTNVVITSQTPNLNPLPPTTYIRNQTPTITWDAVTDDVAVTSLVLRVTDSGSNIYNYPISPVTETSFTLPGTDLLDQGTFTVELIAMDAATNTASDTDTAFLDSEFGTATWAFSQATPLIAPNTTPTLSGTYDINPAPAQTFFAPVNNVEVQIVRPAGPGGVPAFFTTTLSASGLDLTSTTWSRSFNTSALPGEGVYNVNLRVIDLAFNPINVTGTPGIRPGSIATFPQSLIIDFTSATTVLAANTLMSGANLAVPETFTVTFTDATTVSGFTDTDVTITGAGSGTITNVQPLGNNTFSFVFTPTVSGPVTLQIPAAAAQDQAFNPSLASNTFSFIAGAGDTIAPVITGPLIIRHTLPGGNPPPTYVRNQRPIIDWTGVSDNDAVTSLSLRITDSLNNVYTYPVSPVTATTFTLPGTDTIAQGDFQARLIAGDAAGNSSFVDSNFAFMDTIIPTATVTGVSTANPIITNSPTSISFGGTFNDDPGNGIPFSGLLQMEVQISRRNPLMPNLFVYINSFTVPIPSNANATGNWLFNFPGSPALPQEGFYNLNIRPVDRALNPNGLPPGTGVTAIPNGILYDITGPQLTSFTAASSVENDCLQNPETFTVVYSDISTVSGFDETDVTITGPGQGVVSDIQPIGNNSFTFLFTSTLAGDVTLSINDPAVVDQASNVGGGTASLSFLADVTPPDILCDDAFSVVGSPIQTYNPNNPSSVFFSVVFDEPVTNLITDNITISGPGTVTSITPTPGFDTTFVIEVTPTGLGTITLGFVTLVIEDCAGNLFDSEGYEASVTMAPLLGDIASPGLILPDDPNTLGKFGLSTDLDSGVLIVGYPNYVVGGAAVVFEDDEPATKTQTALLLPANPQANDQFGSSVAHSGFWALVGAPYDDITVPTTTLNVGSASFFKRDQDTGVYETASIVFSNSIERESRFGTSVALNGNYALIGEPFGRSGGSVDVFTQDVCAGTWSFQATLVPNDLSRDDNFGISLATDGTYALIGSPRDDDRGTDSGSIYVFRRVGNTWTQVNKIIPGNNVRLDNFGASLDLFNDVLAAGAPGFDYGVTNANKGAGYVYNRTGNGVYSPLALLNASSQLRNFDALGQAIAINEVGEVIIGAPLSDILGVDSGAAFIFTPDNSYSFGTLFTYVDSNRNNFFGQAVGIGQGYAIGLGSGASHPDSRPNSENLYPVTTGVGLLTPVRNQAPD